MHKIKFIQQPGRYSRALTLALSPLALFICAETLAQSSLQDCSELQESEARLACYDEAMTRANESRLPIVRLPRSSRQNVESSEVAGGERQQGSSTDGFGLEGKEAGNETNNSRMFSVADAKHNDFTGWSIEFDNGQVWQQVGTEDYNIRVGERYTIERALMNSFMLGNSSNNRKIRVKRVR